MYTNLPHEALKKILNWFIKLYKKEIKEEIITVKIRGKQNLTVKNIKKTN